MKTQTVFKLPAKLSRAIDEVDRLLAGGNTDLVLDFAGCEFVAVEGLEWLEELLLRTGSLGASVRFSNVQPTIYKVFKIARIEHVLRACGSAPPSGPVC